jgi:glycosyltransferase involved in cell wall biosynthesis
MSLYIDLSEFLQNPITTGIQRIAGEICKYLPARSAIPVRLHARAYVALPPALIEVIGRHFGDESRSGVDEIRRLGAVEGRSTIKVQLDDVVLVPEVFSNPQRLELFGQMPAQQLERCRFIVYDLLPMTHPEYFPTNTSVGAYGYYRLLRDASCCGFISEDTRDEYYGRLKRTDIRGGVVLPLGSDSLGPRANRTTLNRPLTFSVLGTIEPRKNHRLILEAFEPLLREIDGVRLDFIGKIGWVDSEFAEKVQALAKDESSGFRFYPLPGDGAIRQCIEQSRATIYASTAEGYGLPPVESLWVGTPVIASSTIPSLKGRESAGIHLVNPLNAVNLRRAVFAFLDDAYANRKTEETLSLNLPTWRSFTREVLRWCERDAG